MQRKWEKKVVEHLVISHKHRLAAISRKNMHTMGRRTWGKNLAFNNNTCQKKWRRKAIGKMGKKMEGKWGKKSREKIKKKIWKKIQKKIWG